jgi:WD40 repeat protein
MPAEVKVAEANAPLFGPRLRLGTLRFRHGGRVTSLATAADGSILASCGTDGQVRIWDTKTGEGVKRFSGAGEQLHCIALSRDGHWVAAGGQTGMLYYWQVTTGREVRRWQGGMNMVQSIALAPDGRTLASLGLDREIALWAAPTGRKLHSWRSDMGGLLAFSPDGKTLAASVPLNRGGVSFSPDGNRLLPGPDDAVHNVVRLLDPATGEERPGPGSGVALAFSPDGTTLAIGGFNGSLSLWERATGKQLHSLEGHSGIVFRVAFSSDGTTLASLSGACDVRLWDVITGNKRCRIQRDNYQAAAIALSQDAKILYTAGGDHVIRRWDTATGKEMEVEQGAITAMTVAPDGKSVVTAGRDGILQSWNAVTGKLGPRYQGHKGVVTCIAYSADGRMLASAARYGQQNEVCLWQPDTGQELYRWDDGSNPILQLQFLRGDRSLAAVGSHHGHIWETATGEDIHQFGDDSTLYSSFSPDRKLLAAWGPNAVQLWDMVDLSRTRRFQSEIGTYPYGNLAQGYRGAISAQALSPGGQYLVWAAGHENGKIHVFDISTSKEIDLPQGHTATIPSLRASISALAWSHDGKTLASGGGDGQVWLWDLPAGQPLRKCLGHEGPVTSLAFSADDQTLVSGSDDTTALVWDLRGIRDARKLQQPEREWR